MKIRDLFVYILGFLCSEHQFLQCDCSPPGQPVDDSRRNQACEIQLNEICLGRKVGDMQFIELRRYCRSNTYTPKNAKLSGYMLAMVELGETPRLLYTNHLFMRDLEKVEELVDDELHTVSYLYVTGSDNTPKKSYRFGLGYGLLNEQGSQYSVGNDYLPRENNIPKAIFLLYFKSSERREVDKKFLHMPIYIQNGEYEFTERNIDDARKEHFKGKISDFVVFGTTYSQNAETFLRDVLENTDFDLRNNLLNSNSAELSMDNPSHSRCGNSIRDSKMFQISRATPLGANECNWKDPDFQYPFIMRNKHIQHTGQEIVVNVIKFMEKYGNNLITLTGSSIAKSAAVLGMSRFRVRDILNNYQVCDNNTPAKTSCRRYWKREQIDSFDRDKIRTIIASFYEGRRAPYLTDIYNAFMDYKKENCLTVTLSAAGSAPSRWMPICAERINRDDPMEGSVTLPTVENALTCARTSSTVTIHDGFTCSKPLFAKVLRSMGFTYGRLNMRLALLQRPDIVASRARFMIALKRNSESENPMKVTYLDETWIDPNQKDVKGWTLKKPKSMRECRKYSYPAMKQGHGPRIIVLAAGDNDGIIKESVLVYKVHKDSQKLDYHENVNKEAFLRWFTALLDLFDQRNEKHIICVDNAPYHSSNLAPKSSDRKQKMYEWLDKIKNDRRYGVEITLNQRMLKWELWEQVRNLKKKPELQEEVYELDRLAASRGHKILRIPCYQCEFNPIEFAWSHIKRLISRANLNQNPTEIVTVARQVITDYDSDVWKRHVAHVDGLRQKYWEEDKVMDRDPPELIIPLSEDEDDNDCYASTSCNTDNEVENPCGEDGEEFNPDEVERSWEQDRIELEAWRRDNQDQDWPVPSQSRPLPRPTRLFENPDDCDQ